MSLQDTDCTAAQVIALPDNDNRYEVLNGELVVMPGSALPVHRASRPLAEAAHVPDVRRVGVLDGRYERATGGTAVHRR